MKRSTTFLGLALVLLFALISSAAVPKLINFQGILKDGSGNPVPNSGYMVTFTIYNAPAGGINLWSETQSVTTTSGLFSVLLGAATPVPDSAFQDTTRYLGIKVGADPEMTPRQQLVSVAYGFRISSVDGAAGGTITSKVSIGPGHINTGTDAFVAGKNNRARGAYSVVSGGGGIFAEDSNSASGEISTIGGGRLNTATTLGATVSGGFQNTASNFYATVGGGRNNKASGDFATIGGGVSAIASNFYATVGGGNNNTASGPMATVGGGEGNVASGFASTIPGGSGCKAPGSMSLAAGRQAQALDDGAFVWGDVTDAPFSSTAVNQFLIRAGGGVGIGTNSPATTLHVANSTSPAGITLGVSAAAGGYTALLTSLSAVSGGYASLQAIQLSGASFGNLILNASGGNVGIGTTAPAALLHVNGSAGNNTGTWSNLSDRRLKTEILPIQGALKTVEALQGVSFRWKDAKKDAEYGRVRGLIAQDVEKILPEWIKTDPDGYKRLEPIGIDALLIEAIKELKAENEELRKRISELEKSKPQAKLQE